MPLPADHDDRMRRARLSLAGLSVGDSFGERYFFPEVPAMQLICARALIAPPWLFTDDTVMALGIVETLGKFGRIDQDSLASSFADRFHRESDRGYGRTAMDILKAIHDGRSWKDAASEVFNGLGSMGNGAAMRVGPVGAYFADDLVLAANEAQASAEVTHSHPEGLAGAIAVAIAAAFAWNERMHLGADTGRRLFECVLDHTPLGETRDGIEKALKTPRGLPVKDAVTQLGNGSRLTSVDTVPFTIWCSARHLNDYEEAMWTTVSGLGDRDTTCAIVGGIVALSAGEQSIPADWLQRREPLPTVCVSAPRPAPPPAPQ